MSTDQIDILARQPIDEVDTAVLADLGRIVQLVDPVPPGLTQRVRFELTLAALHAEIAELQDLSEAVGVRADTIEVTDTISFTSPHLSLMITVSTPAPDAGTVRIDGWVTAPRAVVELWQDGNMFVAEADEDGRLVWEDVPDQPSRFLIPGSPPVVTPRIEL